MKTKLRLLLAGRSKDAISDLNGHLSTFDNLEVELRHIVNGHADPLYGLVELPDMLLLHINGLEGGELEALLERPASTRPPIVVVSGSDDAAAMRLAMKAGARDFLSISESAEILESIHTVSHELNEQSSPTSELVAVVNAKGGAGATFVACNLAHLAVRTMGESTALIGLDMQFPTLPAYFDMKPRHGLLHAIDTVNDLDEVALNATMASHESGLKLLAARPEDFRFSFDDLVGQTSSLFELLQKHYKNVIVDMPRQLDEMNAQVFSRASRIVLVVQQSLPHIQDATRLQQLLRDQLGVPADGITVVVNRYSKGGEIQLGDIENALPGSEAITIPNQFKVVSESINLGVPMYEHAKQSAVTRALVELQEKVFDRSSHKGSDREGGRISSLFQKSALQQLFGGQ
jgi:pilus assembly protein CpaE